MYFTNKIELSPDVGTTEVKTPTGFFAKLWHAMGADSDSDADGKLALNAVAILQEINRAFRQSGVNNIIRLAKDGYDFYLDIAGKEDDIDEALEKFSLDSDALNSGLFNELYLVVEHSFGGLKLLIEADITRSPQQGKAPITITVYGLAETLKKHAGESDAGFKQRLADIFASQSSYDQFVNQYSSIFDGFVKDLELSLRAHINVEYLHSTPSKRIVRRASPHVYGPRSRHNAAPIHRGYFGFDDYADYTWCWSDLCQEYVIEIFDTDLVGDDESILWVIGEHAINAAGNIFFDSDSDYEEVEEAAYNDSQPETSSGVDTAAAFAAGVVAAEVVDDVVESVSEEPSWLSGIGFGSAPESDDSSRFSESTVVESSTRFSEPSVDTYSSSDFSSGDDGGGGSDCGGD